MKEKIIRILRIIIFDAFRSRFWWRRILAEIYLNYMNKKRRKIFKENPVLPECYKEKFIKRATNPKYKKTLVISFARNNNFTFTAYLKNYDSLFYAQTGPDLGYYMRETTTLFTRIKKIILDNGYNRVICIGTSRSAVFAITASNALADKMKFVQFYSIAFSCGEYRTYPWIYSKFPPLVALKDIASKDKTIMNNVIKFGDTKKLLGKSRENVYNYLIAGERNLADMTSAYVLQGFCKHLKALFIDDDWHFSILNFILENIGDDNKKVKKIIALTLNNNKDDLDIPCDDNMIEKRANTYIKISHKDDKKLFSLNHLIDELITNGKITSLYK